MALSSKLKLTESEARILALQIAASFPNQRATTAEIKKAVPKQIKFTPGDLQRSETRQQEQKWQQIVGNVISHQKNKTSLFSKGFAIRTDDGIIVTTKGLDYLGSLKIH